MVPDLNSSDKNPNFQASITTPIRISSTYTFTVRKSNPVHFLSIRWPFHAEHVGNLWFSLVFIKSFLLKRLDLRQFHNRTFFHCKPPFLDLT